MSFRRLAILMRREALATLRDPFTVSILILVPLMALVLFSSILSTEVEGLDLGVLDLSDSAASRRVVSDLAAQGTFVPRRFDRREHIDRALRSGTIGVAIVIPPDFDRDRLARRPGEPPGQIQVLYDGGEAVLAGNAEGFLRSLVAATAVDMAGGPATVASVPAPRAVPRASGAASAPSMPAARRRGEPPPDAGDGASGAFVASDPVASPGGGGADAARSAAAPQAAPDVVAPGPLLSSARPAGAPGATAAPARQQGIAVVPRALFNPKLEGRPYMIAGTFGFVLSFATTLIIAVSIVNERFAGTFEQLQVTPATSAEILLGKVLPLGGVFSADVVVMMVAAWFLFGVWPAGSSVFFVVLSTFYMVVSLSLGVLISATSATAAEAVSKTVLLSTPLIQLSGFAFPTRNMSTPFRWFAELIPATHYIRVSRAIYLRGEGPLAVLPEILVIAAMGLALGALALRAIARRQ
ncbi:MAG TPA: ABC transporter permease [Candidatus Binatia bacterium]|nr:ABC transporter permease [Candidatus Binatia bacterium]